MTRRPVIFGLGAALVLWSATAASQSNDPPPAAPPPAARQPAAPQPAALADAESADPGLAPAPKDPWKAWALGRFDRALEGFLDRQIARPDDAGTMRNVGAARYRLGDFAGAAEAYRQAAASAADPELQERALYDLGNAVYRQGQLEEAVKAYEGALAIDPEDEDARYNLEFVREEIRRRLEEAKQREQQQQQQEQEQPQPEEQQSEEQQGEEEQQQPEEPQPEAQGEEPQPQPEDQPQQPQPSSGDPEERELSPEEVEALLRSLEEGRPAETAPPKPGRRTRPAKDW